MTGAAVRIDRASEVEHVLAIGRRAPRARNGTGLFEV
jgi:hypothetical protein